MVHLNDVASPPITDFALVDAYIRPLRSQVGRYIYSLNWKSKLSVGHGAKNPIAFFASESVDEAISLALAAPICSRRRSSFGSSEISLILN